MAKKKNNMKTWLIIGGIVIVLLILIFWFVGTYNNFVKLDHTVDAKWANVESNYQRRFDLIPNIVSTVEGAVKFEKGTQTEIAAIRTGMANAKTAYGKADTLEEKMAAMTESDVVAKRFAGLNINVENYPQLKATENFLSLQDELSGTENRINVARIDYNDATKNYNIAIHRIPAKFIASITGFEGKDLFKAKEGAADPVKVEF